MLRGIYAIKALRFSTALSVLKDEFLRSRDYPRCPPTSHLFHRFRQLGYACIKYADKIIFLFLFSLLRAEDVDSVPKNSLFLSTGSALAFFPLDFVFFNLIFFAYIYPIV